MRGKECLKNVDLAAKALLIIRNEFKLVTKLHNRNGREHTLGVLNDTGDESDDFITDNDSTKELRERRKEGRGDMGTMTRVP